MKLADFVEEINHIIELLRYPSGRCEYKKMNKTKNRPLLESKRIRDKRRRAK